MRDQDDGVAGVVQALEQPHDLVRGGRVQVARGFVCQDQRRMVDQRARDRHPLPLPARQLVRLVRGPVRQADGPDRLDYARLARGRLDPGVDQGQLHVLRRRAAREQVERLEDEPDLPVAYVGKLVVGQRADLDAVQPIRAAGRRVEAAQHVHQRRLARTAGAHDGHVLAAADLKVDPAHRRHGLRADGVGLVQVVDGDQDLAGRALAHAFAGHVSSPPGRWCGRGRGPGWRAR